MENNDIQKQLLNHDIYKSNIVAQNSFYPQGIKLSELRLFNYILCLHSTTDNFFKEVSINVDTYFNLYGDKKNYSHLSNTIKSLSKKEICIDGEKYKIIYEFKKGSIITKRLFFVPFCL